MTDTSQQSALQPTALLPKPLTIEQLRRPCAPESLTFNLTSELEPIDDLIGQNRALEAIKFGADINQPGYNLFALGPQGTGRHSAITHLLNQKAKEQPAPDDWVYVSNFEMEHQPLATRLPAGTAISFRDSMDELIDDLQRAIPAVFQSDEYREKKKLINSEFEDIQEKKLEALRGRAKEKDIAIMNTPMGFALAPIIKGEIIKPEVYDKFPLEQRKKIEADIESLQLELTTILDQAPELAKEHHHRVKELTAELTGKVVDASITSASQTFSSIEPIQDRLKLVREDLIDNVGLFLSSQAAGPMMAMPDDGSDHSNNPALNRYRVNVMVANDEDGDQVGAPCIHEEHPTLPNVVGRIEHRSQFGTLVTDFTMIRPGALHRANGGYLLLDARKVLSQIFCWDALKRALTTGSIRIVSAAEEMSLLSTISLEPEPIPLDVKVVLVGERILYYLLCELDPEFSDLFKVQVDFDEEISRSEESVSLYARLIATIANRENLLPLNAKGVAKVVEEVARYANDAEKLTLNVRKLADLLRESDYWAKQAQADHISEVDVSRATAEQFNRASRIRQKSLEAIERNIMLIDTTENVIGQINGLAVSQIGNFAFGRPSRITVRVRMGSGKVVDIEREAKLGGPLHSKGVLILSGFLSANYALDMPMSLWASIVFEQSYGGVDGDSASSAELYALLSALAHAPIKQSLAVTGSVNQLGDVQAIGGVNEKIEGFFDVCKSRGLDGTHGVLIPDANIKHLMLRADVADACANGKFSIYPVSHISQGIELLTGLPAGTREHNGQFTEDSINARVEARLTEFAKAKQAFADSTNGDDDKRNNHDA